MSKFVSVPLPQDLPQDWTDSKYVSPNGVEVGLTEKHGYNYLMEQVNNAQKAAEELGEGLDYMVGVNLLDNWYFADPVHRKLEKYAVSGADYYSDASFTKKVNTLTQATPLTEVTDSYGAYSNSSGTSYYVKPADIRDGYAAGSAKIYTIDRWRGQQCIVSRHSKGITLAANSSTASGYLRQYLSNPLAIWMNKITVSVLVNSVSTVNKATVHIGGANAVNDYGNSMSTSQYLNAGLNVFSFDTRIVQNPPQYPYVFIELKTPAGGNIDIAAVKVEFGPYQTLAHEEATGSWSLNEIPNKGLETVKCNCAPVELGGIGMIVAPEDIGATTANTLANAEVVE